STELSIITPAEMQTAVEIFTRNDQWLSKYETSHQKLIAKAKKEGDKLSPDTDKKLNEWQVSAKQCLKQMKEGRMVYTSKMDEIKKEFTAIENVLEKELYSQMQVIRDKSISIYAKEQREKEAEEARKLQKEQERIRLIADAEQQVRNAYADLLRADKDDLFHAFNTCNAETISGVEKLLKGMDTVFKIERWEEIAPIINSSLLTKQEIENVIVNAKSGKFDKVAEHYKAEIDGYAAYLLSMIPQRREEIAKGVEESKAAAELAKKQRELEAAQQAEIDAKANEEIADAMAKAEMDAKIASEKAKSPSKPDRKSTRLNSSHVKISY